MAASRANLTALVSAEKKIRRKKRRNKKKNAHKSIVLNLHLMETRTNNGKFSVCRICDIVLSCVYDKYRCVCVESFLLRWLHCGWNLSVVNGLYTSSCLNTLGICFVCVCTLFGSLTKTYFDVISFYTKIKLKHYLFCTVYINERWINLSRVFFFVFVLCELYVCMGLDGCG